MSNDNKDFEKWVADPRLISASETDYVPLNGELQQLKRRIEYVEKGLLTLFNSTKPKSTPNVDLADKMYTKEEVKQIANAVMDLTLRHLNDNYDKRSFDEVLEEYLNKTL